MDTHYPVLDEGFVQLDAHLGTDGDIARIARVSTGKGNKTPEEDAKFLDYLWRHGHLSPFEMPVVRLKIKMPIFVARQWVRHRTHSMNEVSGRYVELTDSYYVPEADRFLARDTDNRQASGGFVDVLDAVEALDDLDSAMINARRSYERAVADGAPKEVARIALPVATYTIFFWQQNLRNLLHLLELRLHEHAQWETRQYAEAIFAIVRDLFPVTAEVFERHTLNGRRFSEPEMLLLRSLVYGQTRNLRLLEAMSARLSKSQQREFFDKLRYRTDLLVGDDDIPEEIA